MPFLGPISIFSIFGIIMCGHPKDTILCWKQFTIWSLGDVSKYPFSVQKMLSPFPPFSSFSPSSNPGFNNMFYPASAYQGVNESVPHEIRILISFIPSTGCKVEFYNWRKCCHKGGNTKPLIKDESKEVSDDKCIFPHHKNECFDQTRASSISHILLWKDQT